VEQPAVEDHPAAETKYGAEDQQVEDELPLSTELSAIDMMAAEIARKALVHYGMLPLEGGADDNMQSETVKTGFADSPIQANDASAQAGANPTQTSTQGPAQEPVKEPAPEPATFVISFAGDAMLATKENLHSAGDFNDYASKQPPHYFFDGVREIFANDDYTVVNLENVFTDRSLTKREKPEDPAYWYFSRTANAQILTQSSIEMVSIANNHANDYGDAGYRDTKAALQSAGVLYGESGKIVYLEKNGIKVAVICTGLWNEYQTSYVVNLVKKAEEQSDFQIVFYHGGTEREYVPDQWRVKASHTLVDNGADCVVGNHPHVLQPMEKYHGADIIYSLGNFLFGGARHPENRTMIYQATLTAGPDGVTSSSVAIPCYLYTGESNNYQPAIITDETEKQHVLDFLNGKRSTPF